MRKLSIVLVLMLLLSISYGYSKKLASLPEIMKPEIFRVKDGLIFISQDVSIFIYNMKDFKLVKKFGKKGEGPQEFKINPPNNFLEIEIFPDYIWVKSIGKLSFFSKSGEFLREQRLFNCYTIQPMGKEYVAQYVAPKDNKLYRVLSLFGPDLQIVRNIYSAPHLVQQGGKIEVLKKNFAYQVFDDRVFISAHKDFVLDIYDRNGKQVRTIKEDYELRKVTDPDRQEMLKELKRESKQMWPMFKDRILIGDYYPAINDLMVRDDSLYVTTNKEKEGKFEFFIYDNEGKLLKKIYLPLAKKNSLQPYPYDINEGKLFQVIENMDTDEWELHVEEIK
jgi:hypothetical protein